MRTFLLVLVLALSALMPTGQAAVQLEEEAQWAIDVPVGGQTTSVNVSTVFVSDEPGEAYVKVLSTPWNPAYRNGTAGEAGWWTEASLQVPEGIVRYAPTNGSAPVELGPVEADVAYNLTLHIQMPASALETLWTYRLSYAVAVRPESEASGSGGTLHPSLGIVPTIQVVEMPTDEDTSGDAEGSPDAEGAFSPAAIATVVAVAAAIAVAAGVGVLVVQRRRR